MRHHRHILCVLSGCTVRGGVLCSEDDSVYYAHVEKAENADVSNSSMQFNEKAWVDNGG